MRQYLCWKKIQTPFLEYRYKIPKFIKRVVDRIKRLSYEVLNEHKSKFGEDFADNKKILDQLSIIRSKGLKNEIAGYITKFIKKEIRNEKAKQAHTASSEPEEIVEEVQAEIPESTASEETPVETIETTLVETTEEKTEE